MSEPYQMTLFEPGQIIFERNDPGDSMYYVRSGLVRIELGPADAPVSLGEVGPGGTFGELGMLDREVRSARARAVEATEAVRVTADSYERYLQDRPEVLRGLLRSMTGRLRRGTDLVERALKSSTVPFPPPSAPQ